MKPVDLPMIRAFPFEDTHTDIEHRPAPDGRIYRVTSLPRTIYDMITNENFVGLTAVSESMDIATTEQDLTIGQVMAVAERRGGTDEHKQLVRDAFSRLGQPY